MLTMRENLWPRLRDVFPTTENERRHAVELIDEWRRRGFLERTSLELLRIPDPVTVEVYARLSEGRTTKNPHLGEPDSGWLCRNAICFYNIRATGVGDERGNFLQAAKLLLGERAHAIHVAPFTRYDHNTIYAIVAARSVAPELWHPALVKARIQPLDQVRLFVQAAHSLGKAVGYDLEPHTAQFSYINLEHPEAFRWVKVYTPDPRWLDYYFTPETVYKPSNQRRIASEVRLFVHEWMSQSGIKTFEEEPGDSYGRLELKHQTFARCVELLIRNGYWTVPTHAWSGFGLPRFKGFNHVQNYAEFSYQDRLGADVSHQAYHILTPFCFWNGLPVQNFWNWENIARAGTPNHQGISLYQELFLFWRDAAGFDFVRFDSVDHIWDSCDPQNPSIPFSDRPTPTILRDCNYRIRSGNRPDVASLAERLGDEIRAYETLGFDAILGSSMMENPGPAMLEHDLKIASDLEDLNTKRPFPFTVCATLDTHDTGNPVFRGRSLIELEGASGLLLRLFLARFLQAGPSYRTLYSVMGLTDLSYGLFPANVAPVNLNWVGDRDFLASYHRLEDLYQELRPHLDMAERAMMDQSLDGATWLWQAPGIEIGCKIAYPSAGDYLSPLFTTNWDGLCYTAKKGLIPGHLETLPPSSFEIAWRRL